MIPLVDLKAQYEALATELHEATAQVMRTTAFILGPDVAAFEKEYAAFVGAAHCVGVASGTDALELMVRAAGLGPSDEVLVPANSFIASALGVTRAGAKVRFVDCDDDGLISLESCLAKASSATKAVLAVHLYGQCAPMERLAALCKERGWLLLEDAAQAQGAKRHGQCAGTFGFAGATSFYPGKNLGAFGDAGALTTNDEHLAKKFRALRNYGSEVKYFHPELGTNSRLDTLQAAVLRVKLKHLATWNSARKAAAERYAGLLRDVSGLKLPSTALGNEHVWHLYPVRVAAQRRDAVVKAMQAAGIGVGIHYPTPIHLQGAYASHGHRAGDFPMTESWAAQQLSLPLFPEITTAQQEQVATALRAALA